MTVLQQLNSGWMYLICGSIIAFIAIVCVVFMVRAWKTGKALGMDTKKMKMAITSSATFSILPSVGILLGVIALSGSLGIPWPWLRLSVIGALHYETQVASAAAEQMGIQLGSNQMTLEAFSSIALLMSICIMWGMVMTTIFNKRYINKLNGKAKTQPNETQLNQTQSKSGGFGEVAMVAMFIGMVSSYIGSYIGGFVSEGGLFKFKGDWTPLVVVAVSCIVMSIFTYLVEKKKLLWLENFSIAASMLMGMAAAIIVG